MKTLLELLKREPVPVPWFEGDNIPWNAPDFSARMLHEHLSQDHDLASRRLERIDHHVAWIHKAFLAARPCSLLDLGCGPGLYCERLARLGHRCVGLDYSPASIRHARERAAQHPSLDCEYLEGDLRALDYGTGYDLAMQIFGELNVFKPADAGGILRACARALKPGATLLLEVMTRESVEAFGKQGTGWASFDSGLFSERPHVLLHESFWDEGSAMATRRYFVIDAASGEVTRYAQSLKAYTSGELVEMLESHGFSEASVLSEGLSGSGEFATLTAKRALTKPANASPFL